MDKFTRKICKNKNIYIIFYSDWCMYSIKALKLLQKHKKPFKGYIIEKLTIDIKDILDKLKKTSKITNFDCNHKTRPIIFYNGKYIGGYDKLYNLLEK